MKNVFCMEPGKDGSAGKIINLAQVVDVEFTPGGTFVEFDEDQGVDRRIERRAMAKITTTAVKAVDACDFEGTVVGGSSESKIIMLYGDYAWEFWKLMRASGDED